MNFTDDEIFTIMSFYFADYGSTYEVSMKEMLNFIRKLPTITKEDVAEYKEHLECSDWGWSVERCKRQYSKYFGELE